LPPRGRAPGSGHRVAVAGLEAIVVESFAKKLDHLVEILIRDADMRMQLLQPVVRIGRRAAEQRRDELGLMVDQSDHVDFDEEIANLVGIEYLVVKCQNDTADLREPTVLLKQRTRHRLLPASFPSRVGNHTSFAVIG